MDSQRETLEPTPVWQRPFTIVVAALIVILMVFAWFTVRDILWPPELRKYQLQPEIVSDPFNGPVISPDGTRVVYVREGRLWVHELDQVEPKEISDTGGVEQPFWSPDSKWIGYFQNTSSGSATLRKVPRKGGDDALVSALPEGYPRGAVWTPDDDIIFGLARDNFDAGVLFTVPSQGGTVKVFRRVNPNRAEAGILYPDLLPDGQTLIYALRTTNNVGMLVVQSGDSTIAIAGYPGEAVAFPVYSPTGHIIYQRGFPLSTGIWAIPFDLERRRRVGDAFLVTLEGAIPSVSENGTLVYRTEPVSDLRQLVRVDRQGTIIDTIGQQQEEINFPAFSPDESRVAVTATDQGNMDIWIHDVERGMKTRLTVDSALDQYPVWSPAGDRIMYSSSRHETGGIYTRAADGSDTASTVINVDAVFAPHWSQDGNYLVYQQISPETQGDIWYMRFDKKSEPKAFLATAFFEAVPTLSPDGRYVAYMSNETGRPEIHVKRFPAGRGKWQVSFNGGVFPRWSRQGDELFYIETPDQIDDASMLMAVPVKTQRGFSAGKAQSLFNAGQLQAKAASGSYDISADGQRFVMVQSVSEKPKPSIMVAEHWVIEFEK